MRLFNLHTSNSITELALWHGNGVARNESYVNQILMPIVYNIVNILWVTRGHERASGGNYRGGGVARLVYLPHFSVNFGNLSGRPLF
jgi:hypothetical protein